MRAKKIGDQHVTPRNGPRLERGSVMKSRLSCWQDAAALTLPR